MTDLMNQDEIKFNWVTTLEKTADCQALLWYGNAVVKISIMILRGGAQGGKEGANRRPYAKQVGHPEIIKKVICACPILKSCRLIVRLRALKMLKKKNSGQKNDFKSRTWR